MGNGLVDNDIDNNTNNYFFSCSVYYYRCYSFQSARLDFAIRHILLLPLLQGFWLKA